MKHAQMTHKVSVENAQKDKTFLVANWLMIGICSSKTVLMSALIATFLRKEFHARMFKTVRNCAHY